MIKLLLLFVTTTLIVATGIKVLQKMTWLNRWSLAKTLAFTFGCSIIAVSALGLIVVLF